MKTIELNVTGMKCVKCEKKAADALETVAGVEKAVADHNHDRILVRLADDDASVEEMKKTLAAVEDHDFDLVKVVE